MWIRSLFLVIYGLSAGGLIAGSFLAFLSMIGIVPRLATVTKSAKHTKRYEDCIALGGILGTILFVFRVPIPLGSVFLIAFGLFGGIFTGCLIGALAEMLKCMPVFARRLKLRDGLPYIIYAIAFGKILGCYMQFYR